MIEESHIKIPSDSYEADMTQWVYITLHAEQKCPECLGIVKRLEPASWQKITHWEVKDVEVKT